MNCSRWRGRTVTFLAVWVGPTVFASVAAGPAAAGTYHARDGASLLAAVASANAGAGPSTIVLSAGTYLPGSTVTVSGDVTITGPALAPPAKLDGGAVSPVESDLLLVQAHAKLTLWNVEVTSGGGSSSGAAIDDFGAVDLESSILAGNSGPGLLVQRGATATVRNSTLSDGLDIGMADLGTASLFNVTVASNANGGVDDASGVLRLTNTIIAENGSPDCTRRAATSNHSLDGDGSCGVGALGRTDPKLERLAANGGPTPTRAPRPGSPAIDAGGNSNCPAEDQRHFARTDGHCDIGAYEVGAVPAGAAGGSTGQGGPPSSGSIGPGPWGVSAHGAVRGARHSRITFSIRALVGHLRAAFRYSDPARGLVLRAMTVKSLAIDARRGIATIRGSCVTRSRRRRLGITIVLVSQRSGRRMRIRLGDGYAKGGGLLNGSITFLRASGRPVL